VATQLLAAVAAEHERGGPGLTLEALAQEFGLSPDVVDRICQRLKSRGLIAEVQGDKQGFIPGRAARGIAVVEVLGAFRTNDMEIAEGQTSEALAGLIRDLEEARRTRIEGLTIADLLPGPTRPASGGVVAAVRTE
jgi:DNA-binding IscR family transcriptional regulator